MAGKNEEGGAVGAVTNEDVPSAASVVVVGIEAEERGHQPPPELSARAEGGQELDLGLPFSYLAGVTSFSLLKITS